MNLQQWAARWRVPADAIAELQDLFGMNGTRGDAAHFGKSEAFVMSQLVLEAPHKDCILWRNNVGVLKDLTGRPVRFGLANTSKEINEKIKSSDLIGIRRVLITPAMVGSTIGQFVARETKAPGWHYTGDAREVAQLNYAQLVCSYGGDAAFATGTGTL